MRKPLLVLGVGASALTLPLSLGVLLAVRALPRDVETTAKEAVAATQALAPGSVTSRTVGPRE